MISVSPPYRPMTDEEAFEALAKRYFHRTLPFTLAVFTDDVDPAIERAISPQRRIGSEGRGNASE